MTGNCICVNGISEVSDDDTKKELENTWFGQCLRNDFIDNITQSLTRFNLFIIVVLLVGFACLPFIWAVNSIWFFDEAFRKPAYDEQKLIRKCKYFAVMTFIQLCLDELNGNESLKLAIKCNFTIYTFRCYILYGWFLAMGHRSVGLDHHVPNESGGLGRICRRY